MKRLSAWACCGACAALAGCVDSNSRVTIGETVKLEGFEPPVPRADVFAPDPQSVVGMDRSNWQARTFLVPIDGTHHRATYADPLFLTDVTRRQRGEYPSIESVMDGDGSEYADGAGCQRFTEGVVVPLRALLDMITIPVRLLAEPQTWEYVSPRVSYERWPREASRLLPPEQEPAVARPDTPAGDASMTPAAPAPSADGMTPGAAAVEPAGEKPADQPK